MAECSQPGQTKFREEASSSLNTLGWPSPCHTIILTVWNSPIEHGDIGFNAQLCCLYSLGSSVVFLQGMMESSYFQMPRIVASENTPTHGCMHMFNREALDVDVQRQNMGIYS